MEAGLPTQGVGAPSLVPCLRTELVPKYAPAGARLVAVASGARESLPVPRLYLRSNDGGSLTIDAQSPRDPWHWRVTVESPGLTAAADIDPDLMRYGTIDRLDAYLAALARDWRGWPAARNWGQPPFVLSAKQDGLGHVALLAELHYGSSPDAWHASATIKLDAGQLDDAARQAARLTAVVMKR